MERIEVDSYMEDIGYKLLSSGIQLSDPKLYDAINSLNKNIMELKAALDKQLTIIRSIQDFVSMPY